MDVLHVPHTGQYFFNRNFFYSMLHFQFARHIPGAYPRFVLPGCLVTQAVVARDNTDSENCTGDGDCPDEEHGRGRAEEESRGL